MSVVTLSPSERVSPATAPVVYPDSDGKPLGETDFHITVILYLREALRWFFRHADDVYVAANMMFYYEEGVPSSVCSPDVFVVKGIPKHSRRSYKLWEEGKAPCTVFEITSRGTRLEDLGTKKALYEMLGVREYVLFDPLAEYLRPRLQGFRLEGGFYVPMALQPDGSLYSEELGLVLRPEGELLRVVHPRTGEVAPTLAEAMAQTEAAEARARAEAERARQEAERAARLEAELERLRRQRGQG